VAARELDGMNEPAIKQASAAADILKQFMINLLPCFMAIAS
jgi:hypothetical protein